VSSSYRKSKQKSAVKENVVKVIPLISRWF